MEKMTEEQKSKLSDFFEKAEKMTTVDFEGEDFPFRKRYVVFSEDGKEVFLMDKVDAEEIGIGSMLELKGIMDNIAFVQTPTQSSPEIVDNYDRVMANNLLNKEKEEMEKNGVNSDVHIGGVLEKGVNNKGPRP